MLPCLLSAIFQAIVSVLAATQAYRVQGIRTCSTVLDPTRSQSTEAKGMSVQVERELVGTSG